MPEDTSDLGQHEQVLMRLAKSQARGRGDLAGALREVTEAAAHTLGVERVNVWLFDEGRTKIRCIEHYERTSGEHSSDAEIAAADFPAYFRALDEERALVAHDAHRDPRTAEFSGTYLDEHGITSLLDAPIHAGGEVIGIVCHEHVGPAREWTSEEQRFAASLADFAALALEASERRQAEAALRRSEARMRAVLEHALVAVVIADERGAITNWNPHAEALFGRQRRDVIGRDLGETILAPSGREEWRASLAGFPELEEGPLFGRTLERTAVDAGGREFPVELSITPVRIDGEWIFSVFAQDITSRRRAEQASRSLNAELEERVQDRTALLQQTVREKERLLEELRASSLELLGRLRELERKSDIIREDLEQAQVIQRALLPAEPPKLSGVHVDALYRPGRNVGGDLYDVVALDENLVALYVADAAGHGVAAAMLSVLFKQRLEVRDERGPLAPGEVLRRVNARLLGDRVVSQGLFLTAAFALLDTRTGALRLASAGHTPVFSRRAGGETTLLRRTGPALGLEADAEFAEHRLDLAAGDRLLLYSDGLIEGLEDVAAEALTELLLPAVTGDARDGPYRLRGLYQDASRRAERTAGGGGHDDVTVLVLDVGEGPSHLDNEPTEPAEPSRRAAPAEGSGPGGAADREAESGIWIARGEEVTYLAIRGRGSWPASATFLGLAHAAQDEGKRITVDLAECSYLDSAFLGTLHEVVVAGGTGRTTLHRATPAVRALIEELGLARVLAALKDESAEPPVEPTRVQPEVAGRESQLRLLRAHEVLAELSEENRERFAAVLEKMRSELGEG